MTVLLYTIDSPTNIMMLSVLLKFMLPFVTIIKGKYYMYTCTGYNTCSSVQ